MKLPPLVLKRREERRVRAGHPWVFSNEIDVARSPLGAFAPGEPATLLAHTGQPLGTVYVNPASLICARVVSRRADSPLDASAIATRLERALALRTRLGFGSHYRLVYGESDGLPGLVVDRHGDVLVAQLGTAGMERMRDDVVAALLSLLSPRALLLRNDGHARRLEGLANEVAWVHGAPVPELDVVENGARFVVSTESCQKTGWYYDQRMNRARVASYARDARVLDLFSYVGGFSVQAALGGARDVLAVDSSAAAISGLQRSAALNGCEERIRGWRTDVFAALRELRADGRSFDLVIADPPAFARRRRDLPAAREAYRRLARLAMTVLAERGLLFMASCSSHLEVDALRDCLRGAARASGRRLLLLEQGHQGPDHPVHPALAETAYLKSYIALASAG